MRRFCAFALLVAAVPLAAAFVPALRADGTTCEMACHAGAGAGTGMTCCLVGGSPGHPLLRSCGSGADGLPPASGCSLVAPPSSAAPPSPVRLAALERSADALLLSRPSDPPEPVPLALS